MSIRVEKVAYGRWRQNVRLANAEIELIVTGDVGPRIIHCGFIGAKNLFAGFPEQIGRTGGNQWRLYGGHRLWIAPEHKPETYEPDNGPIQIEPVVGGIRAIQPAGPLSSIQKSMEIRLASRGNAVSVIHRLTHRGRRAVVCSPWALSVMTIGGVALIPLPPIVSHDSRVAPNQNWTLWGYTDLTDPRWTIGRRFILVRQDPRRGPTKFGLAQRLGWAAYWVDGFLFVKRFGFQEGQTYPDCGVNFELYTDKRILELETLGPLVKLAPGQSVRHVETWALFRNVPPIRNEQDAARVMKKYMTD